MVRHHAGAWTQRLDTTKLSPEETLEIIQRGIQNSQGAIKGLLDQE